MKNKAPDIELILQNCCEATLPSVDSMQQWVSQAVSAANPELSYTELVIRVVSSDESQQLNHNFRKQDKPTNVLSFPDEIIPGEEQGSMGDLVLCAAVIEREAAQQGKSVNDHYAHLIVHGVLHLLGFDHVQTQDAETMESLEIDILAHCGISNPYI